MTFLFLYSIHHARVYLKFMTIKINFKNSSFKKNISNIVLFVDDKFGTKI